MARAGKSMVVAGLMLSAAAIPTHADPASRDGVDRATAEQLEKLLQSIDEQAGRLNQQQGDLARERAEIERQRAKVLRMQAELETRQNEGDSTVAEVSERTDRADGRLPEQNGTGKTIKNSFRALGESVAPVKTTLQNVVRAAIAPGLAAQQAEAQEVGERPDGESDVDIAVLIDRGGVLTPVGTLVIDPSVEYTHSSVNRFFFDGVEIVDAVLIGLFEAKDVDRDSATTSIGARYGLSRRFEVDTSIAWLYRYDRTFNEALDPNNADVLKELEGSGIGDLNLGLHYQINKPKGSMPYFVGNLRAKAPTGRGPFDVERDLQTGLETELPSGSGFWTLEPSVTMIWPSDPAVLFANIGYQWSPEQDVNTMVLNRVTFGDITREIDERDETIIETVNPGDAISASVGIGIGLNDSVSLSFGYEHTWSFGTETTQTTQHFETPIDCTALACNIIGPETADPILRGKSTSQDSQVGALLIGASINASSHVGLNFNVAVGVTEDSPDVRLSFRMPLSFRLRD